MCGIAGVFPTQRGISKESLSLVELAIGSIRHRGPDSEGFFNDDQIVFGSCRLSIVDISGGSQPNFNSDKTIISVFNGEIYNYRELRNILEDQGVKFNFNSDSECIPYLYEVFGLNFASKLRGMFAIAIWDKKKQELILVRDRLGEKPLWYSNLSPNLVFASEVKALFAMGVKPEIRKKSIPEYLQFGYVNSPNSPYEHISQVPPGNILIYSSKNRDLKMKQYWSPNIVEMSPREENNAESELRDLLHDSIISQLNSERPIGTLLSGGVDSSLVTAIAARHSTERLFSFSLGFEDSLFDESRYAIKVANYLNTNHSQLILGSNNTKLLMQVIRHLDIPFADSSLLPTYAISQLAREKVVVVLGGDGGDEVFGGYQRYKLNVTLSKLNYLLKILPQNAFRKLEHRESRVAKALSLFGYSKSDLRYQRMMSLVSKSELESIVIGEIRSILESDSVNKFSFSKSDLLLQMQLSDINSYLPGDLLFKTDIASMAHGLEMRSPLLDHRIVSLGLNLQNRHKIGVKNSKPILRKLLFELIPKSLVDRPKKGFGVPLANWLRVDFETIVNDNLLTDHPRISDWINMEYLSFCISQHKKGENYSGVIWPLLVMELVIRKWEQ